MDHQAPQQPERLRPPRSVVVLAAAPARLLDLTGPIEVLTQAGRIRDVEADGDGDPNGLPPLYDVAVHIVPAPDMPSTSAGLPVGSTISEEELRSRAGLDTLIVVGGDGARHRAAEPAVRDLVRHLAPRSRRVVGVCTGSFILAAAGLLDGRRVVTHWRWCAELARRHPAVRVDPEPIYIRDGNVWTSAGVTAGMDLALALVEEDHGHTLALALARDMVLFLRRSGGQKQFSAALAAQTRTSSNRFGDLLAWMSENLHRPLPVEDLAAHAHLSPRQFARAFRDEVGVTPAAMLERLRVEAARRRLEDGGAGIAAVVATSGFGTEETMRRAFLRQVGTPPGDYRERFRREAARSATSIGAEECVP